MKNMLNILFGNLNIKKQTDYIIVPIKVLYIIYSIPFLMFALLLAARSFGAFGSSKSEKIGIIKKILLHFANIFWSYCLWVVILSILEEKLNIKLRPHLF
ncbi:hypothetical protein CLHUN_42600 [Ruminiclostridium hungatei]|uniref:Uncharacterized protein n=1 Tax=Ruminiclostridium hungatei TaxID=48256 RepID=A0A1V4SD72_RUMHU|nr:hypothetical protein [Ruminiclostridium hungatei]OPX41869.1 hypothetical protein CLHUN_42600 [Ruminiclostridium hungatei]